MINGNLLKFKLHDALSGKTHLNYVFSLDEHGNSIHPIKQDEVVLAIDVNWMAPHSWGDDEKHANVIVLCRDKIVAVSKSCVEVV